VTFESSKTFRNLPCAHRRHQHDGHCAFIHGYSRSFTFWFRTNHRDANGFVMDFGELKEVKGWLEDHFDHTMLLDADDPLLPEFKALEEKGACKLVVYDDVGMEGTALFVKTYLDLWVKERTRGRVWVHSVEVRENDKNSARLFGDRRYDG
jgi:6-pyruvoyltetrahydropterin/6-carboxytetrahydropterin synthase